MKGFVGAILLIIGIINILAENFGLLGWLAAIVGVVVLASTLSGPYQKRSTRGNSSGVGIYSDASNSNCSGSSGDCGGGGGD